MEELFTGFKIITYVVLNTKRNPSIFEKKK